MKFKAFLLTFLLLVSISELNAEDRKELDRPFLVGPHYPLVFMSTTYEPDSAFTVRPGHVLAQLSNNVLNTYVFSSNSRKADDSTASASEFDETTGDGYSVYFDGEINRQIARLYFGLTDSTEIQFTYRQIRFVAGALDKNVEDFHSAINVGNQGRENTEQDLLEIYIKDNQTDQLAFQITEESSKFHKESITLGLKFLLKDTKNEAISLTISSNFGDVYIERGVNEIESERNRDHENFNDVNYALNYTSLFDFWSLYLGVSVAKVGSSLLGNSPDELVYRFAGTNFHLSEHWDFLFQVMEYSSPFPKDNTSTIDADIREITAGFRLVLGQQFALELGLIENQTQGPQNIDIAFFENIMFYF